MGVYLETCYQDLANTESLQLASANFRVIVNLAACRSVNPETLDKDLAQMRAAGITIVPDADTLQSLPEQTHPFPREKPCPPR